MAPTKALRILLAQPDSSRAEPMRRALESRRHVVEVVECGEEAAARLENGRYDWVVAEAILPRKSGFALCLDLTRRKVQTCFAITVDVEDTFVRGLARECGARVVLKHPIADESLIAAIEASYSRPDVATLLRDRERRIRDGTLVAPEDFSLETESAGFMDALLEPGTGLCNHTYLVVKLAEEFKKARRYGIPLSCLVVSLEGYADVSERGGEEAAEETFARSAGLLLTNTRDVDVVGRAGPGRFLVLLPSTGRSGAEVVAQRLVSVLADWVLADATIGPVRVGIAFYPSDDVTSPEELVRASEDSLGRARLAGRTIA